eukprot:767523-Hanusia_phi.AAC.5
MIEGGEAMGELARAEQQQCRRGVIWSFMTGFFVLTGHDHGGEAVPDEESKDNAKLANMRMQFSMLEDQLLDTLREALQPNAFCPSSAAVMTTLTLSRRFVKLDLKSKQYFAILRAELDSRKEELIRKMLAGPERETAKLEAGEAQEEQATGRCYAGCCSNLGGREEEVEKEGKRADRGHKEKLEVKPKSIPAPTEAKHESALDYKTLAEVADVIVLLASKQGATTEEREQVGGGRICERPADGLPAGGFEIADSAYRGRAREH